MSKEFMITTIDNPFNPFKDFDQQFIFDVEKGYNSCELLARFAHTSDSLSEAENNAETESAIDRILAIDLSGMYKKVTEESFKDKEKN